MAQISIINLSEVLKTKTLRLDTEYWLPKYLKQHYKNNKKINDVITTTNLKNIKSLKNINTFDYLEISNIELNSLSYKYSKINFANMPSRATYILKNKDICISTVRPNRNAIAYINELDNDNIAVATSGLCVIRADQSLINTNYLYTLLKTKYFIDYLIRENTATMYPAVTNDDVLNFPIPSHSMDFQNTVSNLITLSYELQEESKELYNNANDILENELDIKNMDLSNSKKFTIKTVEEIKNSSDTLRIDAEFFQDKYEKILNKIIEYKHGFDALENIIEEYNTGFGYKRSIFANTGINLIKIANVKKGLLDIEQNPSYIKEIDIDNLTIAKKGNLLLSMSGSIGNVCVIENHMLEYPVNQRVFNLKLKNNHLPYFYVLLLNSTIIQEQINRISVGGLQVNLSSPEILKLKIPLFPKTLEEKISLIVHQSYAKRYQSKQLLEISKKSIEIAIEESEKQAMQYIAEEYNRIID